MILLPGNDNDQLMAIAAHRYCLGRQSYIVGACLDWLRATWGQLTRKTQLVILRDTIDALINDRAGSPTIDAPLWKRFAEWAWGEMDAKGRDSLRDQTAWKLNLEGKAWPLSEGPKPENREEPSNA